MPKQKRAVFVSVGGQDDNVGDSLLRRGLLESLRGAHAELHLFVGTHSEGYKAGLGLHGDETLYRSYRSWRVAALKASFLGRGVHVYNAGEIQINKNRIRTSMFELLLNGVGRLHGNRSIHTGVGIRGNQKAVPRVMESALRACGILTWRDPTSRDLAGVGSVAPDWAFSIAATMPESPRNLIAITMRGDRPEPSDEWFSSVRSILRANNVTPIVVVQVARDHDRGAEIAARLEAELVEWQGSDHAAQEAIVREVYSRSIMVISDRLHALIMGATEGALPFGFATGDPEKLTRTLAGGHISRVTLRDGTTGNNAVEFAAEILARRSEILTDVTNARVELDELAQRMIRSIDRQGGAASSRRDTQ